MPSIKLLLLLSLFALASCNLSTDGEAQGLGSQNSRKSPRSIVNAAEAVQIGLEIALLQGFTKNLDLYDTDLGGIEESLPYFERATHLDPGNVNYKLDALLIKSLILQHKGTKLEKEGLIRSFQPLPTSPEENARVNFYLGYMHELLFEDVATARTFWKVARSHGILPYQENFWDDQEPPQEYIRHQYMKPNTYKHYLHPLLVYLFIRDQYQSALDVGIYPVFPSDEHFIEASRKSNIKEVIKGFEIQMGRDEAEVKAGNEFFNKNEFIVLRHLVSPEETALLSRWYDGNVANGTWKESYDVTLMRTNVYNDRLGFFYNKFHEKLLNRLTRPRPVKMAYSFLCHYEDLGGRESSFEDGPNLRPHTDRMDNEITLSVHLNDPIWPIFVHVPRVPNPGSAWRQKPSLTESVEVRLRAGDAVLFSGRAHTHWRDTLPTTIQRVSSVLNHFVDEAFDFIKFRQSGEPSIY